MTAINTGLSFKMQGKDCLRQVQEGATGTEAKPGRGRGRASAKFPPVVLTVGKAGRPKIAVHEILLSRTPSQPCPSSCLIPRVL